MADFPAERFVCPSCKAAFGERSRFCRHCGTDMERASALDMAATQARGPAGRAGLAPGASVQADPWLGRVVDGRYKVLDLVGRGGMGVVYKVQHIRLSKIAAMKVIHPDLLSNPDAAERFEREALAATRLGHPNSVQVFDFGVADGATYLIMEYVRGVELSTLAEAGPMPWAKVATISLQVCAALEEAHNVGVVHRDIKPENVLLARTSSGREIVKVLDFGLAKFTEAPVSSATEREQIMGTPYYMAPEQIRGDGVDARADIYSLGCMMYYLLTGTHPYSAPSPLGVLTQHLTAPVPNVAAVAHVRAPTGVAELLQKAMAKLPDDRFLRAGDMARAIESLMADVSRPWSERGTGGLPDDSDEESQRLNRADLAAFEHGLRRRRLWLSVGGGAVLLTAVAGVTAALMRKPPPRTVEREPNNTPEAATLAPVGVGVRGMLGARISLSEPDRDWFRFTVSHRQPVTAAVSGIPNMDITLRLLRGNGQVVASIDEAGVGGAERITRRVVEGDVFLEISQVSGGGLPIENVSDPYEVQLFGDDAPQWETEPNETASDATELVPNQPLQGALDARSDSDWLRFTGASGTYELHITSAQPIRWQIDGAPGQRNEERVTLRTGSVLRLWRSDADAPKSGAPSVDWRIVVTAK